MAVENQDEIVVYGPNPFGRGIVESVALNETNVTLTGVEEFDIDSQTSEVKETFNRLVSSHYISEDKAKDSFDNITVRNNEGKAEAAKLVIEAASGDLDKALVYPQIEDNVSGNPIIATTTSTHAVSSLSDLFDSQVTFCGLHFHSPTLRTEAVEICGGQDPNPDTIGFLENFTNTIGKTPIVLQNESPGYIINRFFGVLLNEACIICEQGSVEFGDIDATLKYRLNFPMGIFEFADYRGIDTLNYPLQELATQYKLYSEPSELITEKVSAGNTGVSSGQGFYTYPDNNYEVDLSKYQPRDGLKGQLLAIMANEIGHLLDGNIASLASIEEAIKLGGSFPNGPGGIEANLQNVIFTKIHGRFPIGPAELVDREGLSGAIKVLKKTNSERSENIRYSISETLTQASKNDGFYKEPNEFQTINTEVSGPNNQIGHLILNRPFHYNSINLEMLEEYPEALQKLEENTNIQVILIQGAGETAFCVGADVTSISGRTDPLDGTTNVLEGGTKLARKYQEVFRYPEQLDTPVIAVIDGFCLAGGFEIAAFCDYRIASRQSKIGLIELGFGAMPGGGGTQLAKLVGESRAKQIIMTADVFTAAELEKFGFINEVHPKPEFDSRVNELATSIAGRVRSTYGLTKRSIHAGRFDLEAGLETEAQGFGKMWAGFDRHEDRRGITGYFKDTDLEFVGK